VFSSWGFLLTIFGKIVRAFHEEWGSDDLLYLRQDFICPDVTGFLARM